MKRKLLIPFVLLAMFSVTACTNIWTDAKQENVRKYYRNLTAQRYGDNADILYLYERFSDVPTPQSDKVREAYMQKIGELRKTDYKVVSVGEITFDWNDHVLTASATIKVLFKGKMRTYYELIQMKDERIMIDYSEDPSHHYRDGILRVPPLAKSPEDAIRETLSHGVEDTLESSRNVEIQKHATEEDVYITTGDFKYLRKKGFVHRIYQHRLKQGIGGWVVESTEEVVESVK